MRASSGSSPPGRRVTASWRPRTRASTDSTSASVGLANVDERLRTVYGNQYGIVVETAPGLGTKVTVRVPKSGSAADRG